MGEQKNQQSFTCGHGLAQRVLRGLYSTSVYTARLVSMSVPVLERLLRPQCLSWDHTASIFHFPVYSVAVGLGEGTQLMIQWYSLDRLTVISISSEIIFNV